MTLIDFLDEQGAIGHNVLWNITSTTFQTRLHHHSCVLVSRSSILDVQDVPSPISEDLKLEIFFLYRFA